MPEGIHVSEDTESERVDDVSVVFVCREKENIPPDLSLLIVTVASILCAGMLLGVVVDCKPHTPARNFELVRPRRMSAWWSIITLVLSPLPIALTHIIYYNGP